MTAAAGSPPSAGPWDRRAALASSAGVAGGAALLVVAWIGASGAGTFRHQTGWLQLGVVGSAVAAAAQAGWLLHGRRQVGALRRRVLPTAVPAAGARPAAPGDVAAAGPGPAPGGALGLAVPPEPAMVAIAEGRRYHRPGCLLVRGKPTIAVRGGRGREACEVCRP